MFFPNFFLNFGFEQEPESELFLDLFLKIDDYELKTKNNELYSKINSSTKKISSYFESSLEKFPSLFENNIKTFDECLTYLEKIAIPNKCVCAGVIDDIPGWRCVDCSYFENSIYCHNCFINSKDLHKGHKVLYLYSSHGMCDCGDPAALNIYCSEHSGPFIDEKQIEEYIIKSFGKKVVENLRKFFDEFFLEYSKYFILTSKCELFMEDFFYEKFNIKLNEELENEKLDVEILKSNFCILFQNLIYFLRLITKNNFGMLHLIATYFLKNSFESKKLENEYMTEHKCIEINHKYEIIIDDFKGEKHICKCPFLRLFLENYRNDVKLDSKEDEEQFIYSFVHNLHLRCVFGIIYFFTFQQNLYNLNSNIMFCRTQFYLDNILELIFQKTTFFEDSVEILYKYIKIILKLEYDEDKYVFQNKVLNNKLINCIGNFGEDIKYFTSAKMKPLITQKTEFFKNLIDLICLFHNINEFESIFPHPIFQTKEFSNFPFEINRYLSLIIGYSTCCFEWKKIEKIKEIYKYIIYKILHQEKEGIKQLKEKEFSFHLLLYKSFGILINAFCFNYSLTNNCTILESINYFKKNFFESQEEINNFVDIILKDYFKYFGFICGTKNNFFNYYDQANLYFIIYTNLNYYQNDFTLLKYLFILSENQIDINSYLNISNIENVYSTFNNIFNLGIIDDDNKNEKKEEKNEEKKENSEINIPNLGNLNPEQNINMILNNLINNNLNKTDEKLDEFNIFKQLEALFELLINILKDDSSCYYSFMNCYEELLSSKTKIDFFDNIKKNKYIMEDLKNVLQEKILLNIISNGNLIDMQKLEKNINDFLLILFEDNNTYNQIFENLTYNKMDGETKMFYLKDECLKLIDFNYFISHKDRSAAQKYILDFKKDIVKTYNYHFYNNSELTFDFFESVYQKVLLNKDNLELILKIIEKLLSNDEISKNTDKKSIRNILLPIMLNYLQIFNVINTKSFIEFKIANKTIINKLYDLLFNFIKDNEKNNFIDKDLDEQVKEILNQINIYQLIYDNFGGDLSKLNKFDYNINIIKDLRNNQKCNANDINIMSLENEINDNKKQKSKITKEKLKLLMKKKNNNFMSKIESNEILIKAIDEHINDIKNMNNKDDEIMCFYCRNSIKLNSFEEPYGKSGLFIKDLFFINSIRATLREELSKLELTDDKNKLREILLKPVKYFRFSRIISCGHYFHNSCFLEGCKKDIQNEFTCPLCLKNQNILIPPLTLFHDKYIFLKSSKIHELFDKNENTEQIEANDELNLFNTSVINYLMSINIFKNDIKDFSSFLKEIFPFYQTHINYLENIFYIESTTFHKTQQIDNIKNFILSLRVFVQDSKDFNKYEIVKFIKETILNLATLKDDKYIYNYSDEYMHYCNLFEKIILSLQILFDYEELKESFKYILLLFLPFITFGYYFKILILQKRNNKINEEQFKLKLSIKEIKNYLQEDNKNIMKYLFSFLKKFFFIKLVSDYQNKNEDLINNFSEMSNYDVLALLDINKSGKNLKENEFCINDIINMIQNSFNSNDIFYQLLPSDISFDKILNLICDNINKFCREISFGVCKELFIQFTPIKFDFINLENNIFDFIIKNTGKKCNICKKTNRKLLLCLICGEKVCSPTRNNIINDEAILHADMCTGDSCIFIDMNNMKLNYIDTKGIHSKLYPLYVNQIGSGPKKIEITDEFHLSQEKLKLIRKNFVCKDFYFN